MRADGWARLPLIRMTNVSLLPGAQSIEEVFDVPEGIYMETNKSWSIDDKRYNFQFGCEIAWEIRNGKKGRMLADVAYQSRTQDFWGACAAIADQRFWENVGLTNDGKGQPSQVNAMSHGCAPALFRRINVLRTE